MPSPSLRGSGLKFHSMGETYIALEVSLFTREWIEMQGRYDISRSISVSLFTREWIEIRRARTLPWLTASPSLRGSGLKYQTRHNDKDKCRLPLYEGVD